MKNYPYRQRDFALLAAEAALAARDQGKFREMHRALLRDSPRLDRERLVGTAREIGLDVRRFTESLDGMKHAEAIDRDIELAASLEVYSTPTFFLNGRKIVGNRDFEYLKKAVDEELAAATR